MYIQLAQMRLSSNLRAVDIHACREATGVQGILLFLLLSLHVVDSDPLSVLEQEHRHLDHKMVHILFSATAPVAFTPRQSFRA